MVKTIKRELAKVNKIIHPKSRKAQRLHQKANRLITRGKSKKVHAMRQNAIAEKLLWFKEQLIPNVNVYSSLMCLKIIEKYLGRFDNELEQISIVHSMQKRKNRRFASREDILKMTSLHEKEEFETCGLEIPDLMNKQQLELLRNWNGELRFLQNFHLKRYTRNALERNKDSSEISGVLDVRMEDDEEDDEDDEENDDEDDDEENDDDKDDEDENEGENADDKDEHEGQDDNEDEKEKDTDNEDEKEKDNDNDKMGGDDSEWSDVAEEEESEKVDSKTKKTQRKKSGHAQRSKVKKHKKMDIDG